MKDIKRWIGLLLVAAILVPASVGTLPAHAKDRPRIFLYHHIDRAYGLWHLTPEKFEQQLMYLSANGYHTVSVDAYVDSLQSGTALPDKPIVLTFDDSYADNYLYAFPLLKRYGMIGTFYIITRRVGLPGYLTWSQIKEMQQSGMEIGAHTMHHPFLTKMRLWRAYWEMHGSRIDLEQHLGIPITTFAFPYNDHNQTLAGLARMAGFRDALTVSPHSDDIPGSLFEIPRFTVTSGERLKIFAFDLTNG